MPFRVKSKKPSSGFILIDFLFAISILLIVCSLMYIPIHSLKEHLQRFQLETASQMLAADLRALQQEALFSELPINRLIVFANKKGYILEANNRLSRKRVDFFSNGCDNVYFYKCLPGTLRFTTNGAPSEAGEYILKHSQNDKLTKRIVIQVASGRVDVE